MQRRSHTCCRSRSPSWTGPQLVASRCRATSTGAHYIYDLADEADFRLMYERVIREAQTRDDLSAYLNAASLRQVWCDLFLPVAVKTAWGIRFPELREHGTTAAAAGGRAAPVG